MEELRFKMDKNVTTGLIIDIQTPCKVRIKQGILLYRRNDENKCVNVSKDYENYFNATFVKKVNTECRGPEIYPAEEEFYPTLHWLLIGRRNWGSTFQFRDRSTFMIGAGIFGVVGVSQFPYHFDANAFCELWGLLTNTLHRGAGEIEVLPILGATYEEFLPPNKDLTGHNKYPATVVEMLRIHAKLCRFHKKFETQKKSPLRISCQERIADLNVTAKGELPAFLAFWLSCFVLPHGKEVIRPEAFVMAALMASGQRISLAPTVLGYIYHDLGDATSDPDHPGKANTIFPSYYVIGWLAELFPCFYRRRLDSNCPGDFPTLFVTLDCLEANFLYPKLDTFSEMGDIFSPELALIVRTLVMGET
ncbi:LOW QUALITY PROTEIN: hypothetical protein Cgig2_032987 [Carnegiea gigantea]|uniref:Aminotransferase-like plant mobile domain-containing protein n=1 Tax=Carnegiea gigantea TaxID=171969 RepID=A0A9Q1JQM9_9CARY|nr:LOW QUALITY PROTEIN: hypothetical protein Cgig2_032987 [Carnegiea gigantea]